MKRTILDLQDQVIPDLDGFVEAAQEPGLEEAVFPFGCEEVP